MKRYFKRISILLTILLILSSFPIAGASAKVSDNARQDAELRLQSIYEQYYGSGNEYTEESQMNWSLAYEWVEIILNDSDDTYSDADLGKALDDLEEAGRNLVIKGYVVNPNTTFLNPSFTDIDGVLWYAWTWDGSGDGRWVKGDKLSNGYYCFTYLDSNVLFVRSDSSKTIDWNNGSVYNQTEDLENHNSDYVFEITDWKSDSSNNMQGHWVYKGDTVPPTNETVTVEQPTTDPTLPTTYLTEPTVSDGIIGNLKDGYKLCYQYTPAPPWMKAFYYQYGKYIFVNHNNASESGHGFYIQKDDEKLMLSEAFDKGITDIEEVVAIILPKDISTFNPMNIVDTEKVEGDWKDLFSEFDFPQDENNTEATMLTIPTSESATGDTEPTATTVDSTSHCTEHDLPYSPEFEVALANYSNSLVGSALSVGEVDIFYYDKSIVVFGMTDMLCTVGEEDIDGYHFENWNFFPREANKTGYCVYYNGTIYNLPDAVKNNIMSARALASIIPHSSMIDQSTTSSNPTGTVPTSYPTEPTTDTSATFVTEPTDPTMTTATTENPTGHCTDHDQELLKMQFATELVKYSNELGYSDRISLDNVYSYTEDYKNYIFAIKFNYDTASSEVINGYYFVNHGFMPNNSKNKTGLCVFDGTKIYDLPAAIKLGIVTAPTLSSVIPYSQKIIDEKFVTKLNEYTQDLGFNQSYTENDILYSRYSIIDFYGYCNAPESWVLFGLKDTLCTDGIEVIGGYKFCNPSFCGQQYTGERTNLTGYCVYYNNEIYSIAEAVKLGIIMDGNLAALLPYTAKMIYPLPTPTIPDTEQIETNSTETTPTQPATTAPVTYNISKAKVSAVGNKTYTGKAITPTVKVTYNGKILLKNKDYTLSYKNNKNVGTASIIITGKGSYTETKTVTFKIVKAANTMTVKATAKTVKYSKLKNAKQTVSAITVKKAIGKVSYKKTSGKSFFRVNRKTGKITIKKGTKKGTYTIKIKVTAEGKSNYKSGSKTTIVKIKIK
ncbi:MAG: hypothetical protein IJT79_00515 [Ruminococcus sp.]|nr:hypothetical protein [Ruminococcus sp.]